MKEAVSVGNADNVIVSPGDRAVVDLEVTVAEGYHVQANPPSLEFLVPLTLSFRKQHGLRAESVAYPRGEPYHLEGFGELDTYGGTFSIRVEIEADLASQPGEFVLRGRLRYQACDDSSCLFPASIRVALPVRVTRTAEQTTEAGPGKPVACGAETA